MSLTYFPQISGITSQRPYSTESAFLHSINDMPTGARYGYSWRTHPLSKFSLNFAAITDSEVATLETFFNNMNGRLSEFVFLDPAGNLIATSETYADGSTDPYQGIRAGTTSSLSAVVLPSDGDGIYLCTSIFVKPTALSQSFTIGITGNTETIVTHSLGWQRISHSTIVSGNSSVSATFSGPGTPVYGWQCAPLRGPGSYSRSEGVGSSGYGFHQHCRFDQDSFSTRYTGPNENSLTLSVAEIGF